MEGPKNFLNGITLWPSSFTSQYISKDTQNTNSEEYELPYVYCNVIYNRQDVEAIQVPINRRVDKKRCGTYTQWNITW